MANYLVGYSATRRLESNAVGGGRLYRRDSPKTPAGFAHRVVEGETAAICGAAIVLVTGPWPPGFARSCRKCAQIAASL
ncbi:hypothetical protein GCM10009765_71990 [Fodinicola feengrottensis]|uniref:Uncharacterized protein n=1 Tax=Fodinicola feengrottensis TaxID=435914 RepID=A0ABN2IVY5_9ACTN